MSLPTTPGESPPAIDPIVEGELPAESSRPAPDGAPGADVDVRADADVDGGRRSGWRTAASRTLTVLTLVLVYLAVVAPNELGQVTPAGMVRIPLEAVVGVLLVIVLPTRLRTVVAVLGGAALGLLTIVRVLDMGFITILARHFDPVFDWIQLGNATTFLTSSIGQVGSIAAAVGAGLLAVGLVLVLAAAVLRLSRVAARHRTATLRVAPVLGLAWVACFAAGAQIVAPVPVAAWSSASLAYRTSVQVPQTVHDYQAFVAQAGAADPFREIPSSELLSGLAGKDVVLSFVESYGRSAVEDPAIAPDVDGVLDEGTRRLEAAGFAARSAFLTSPTAGGGSWLAHATMLSGLWVTNQQSYRTLVEGDRLTLNGAFQRAGWDTVGIMPGLTDEWPERSFYDIDRLYDFSNLGYRGEAFSGFHTPDQYTLSAFERLEHSAPDHAPMMVEMPLVTSHFPWTPTPQTVGWDAVGDGTVYDTMTDVGDPFDVVWSDPGRVKAAYAHSVGYSLESLISWVETYGDDDTVLVFLGDHQPAPVVTGDNASRDVPITIVARDPAVLDRISGWGWDTGLNPDPQAPVWRMDSFRDRFLTAFDAEPQPRIH